MEVRGQHRRGARARRHLLYGHAEHHVGAICIGTQPARSHQFEIRGNADGLASGRVSARVHVLDDDEMVHTGYAPMAHYLMAMGVNPLRG